MDVASPRTARPGNWMPAKVGAVWRAFDLQIATYAALLACFGLAMAYSNSAAGGGDVLQPGSVFLRGLLWAGLALVVFVVATAFDYHWLKTFAWPLYFVQLGLLALTLAIGSAVGGTSRCGAVFGLQFQFGESAKLRMLIVLRKYLGARMASIGSLWSTVRA